MARVSAGLPDVPLAALREGRAALLITEGADGFPAAAFTWAVALDATTVRFGADHGSSALANLERTGRASLEVIGDEPFLILIKGGAAPARSSIEAARGLGVALWEMLVVEVRDQSWPGARVRSLGYEWAPEQREKMQAVEQAVFAEMREAAPRPPPASETPRDRALAYLGRHHVATLATSGSDGPWAAAVFYANDGFRLYFLSLPTTRHGRNLAAHPRAAATVQEDYRDWPEIKGVQMEGRTLLLAGSEREQAISLYARKFPVIAAPAEPRIAEALTRVGWYCLVPDRVYFVDNAAGFGHRDQVL